MDYPANAQANFSDSEVISICKDELSRCGIPEINSYQPFVKSYTIQTHGRTTWKWLVVFRENSSPEGAVAYAVFRAPPGMIESTATGQNKNKDEFTIVQQRLEWEAEKGLYHFWSVEDKAKFNQEVLVPLGWGGSDRMPSERDIPQDEALQIARSAIKAKFILSDSEIDAFLVETGLMNHPSGKQWVFVYRFNDQTRRIPFQNAYAAVIDSETGEIADLISYEDEWKAP